VGPNKTLDLELYFLRVFLPYSFSVTTAASLQTNFTKAVLPNPHNIFLLTGHNNFH